MKNLKISIITVSYNSERTIEKTILSVISQTYQNLEYLIIDGGSKDETRNIIKKYAKHVDVFISEKDDGMYDAINKGIKLATGQVIGILNSDDEYSSDSILSTVSETFQNNKIDMCWGDVNFVDNSGNVRRKYSSKYASLKSFRFGIMPAHPSFFCKKEQYIQGGLYRKDFEIAADYELIMRFVNRGLIYKYLPIVMVDMKLGGKSTSGIKSTIKINQEILKACRLNDVRTNYIILLLKYPLKLLEIIR